MFVCYYCSIIANNFGLHSTVTASDRIFKHVGELEEECAVTSANLFEAGYTLPFQARCLHHAG